VVTRSLPGDRPRMMLLRSTPTRSSAAGGGPALAGNWVTAVQAAEIRLDGSAFRGVQYRPEIALDEIAGALRRQAAGLIGRVLPEAGATLTPTLSSSTACIVSLDGATCREARIGRGGR
jgi:hypothetical protein